MKALALAAALVLTAWSPSAAAPKDRAWTESRAKEKAEIAALKSQETRELMEAPTRAAQAEIRRRHKRLRREARERARAERQGKMLK